MGETLIDDLATMVESACRSERNVFGYGIWTHHIRRVVEIAKGLAVSYGADAEVVEIAALLHDFAGIRDETRRAEHHIHGADEAERILGGYSYPPEKIELVRKCILNHRGSVPNEKSSPEESCVADADAMAHMQELGSLFYVAYRELGMDIDRGTEWIREKIERDWNKMSARGRARFGKTHEEIRHLLG